MSLIYLQLRIGIIMNVINAHLVGYSKAAKSHVISFHSVVSACCYQGIPLQIISFL